MSESAHSKTGSGDSQTGENNDGKPEFVGKLADTDDSPARVEQDNEPARDQPARSIAGDGHKGRHDESGQSGSLRGAHDDSGRGPENAHGRHERGDLDSEAPGRSPAQERIEAQALRPPRHGDHLSADREPVPEGERREPPHRVEAPVYRGPMPGEVHPPVLAPSEDDAEVPERSAGDRRDHAAMGPERHAAMITGEWQAGHRYPHQ